MSTRYAVYPYSEISPSIPYPAPVHEFNVDEAALTGVFDMTSTASAPVLGVAASAVDGFYVGYALTDTTIGESRQITAYNGTTKTATLSSAFSGAFAATDSFATVDPTNWYFAHMQPGASGTNDAYASCILLDKQTKSYVGIYAYDAATRVASLSSFFPSDNSL